MQIIYHIGANCTDEDRLLKSLLRNADILAEDGVKVPGPGKYRRLLRETIQGLDGTTPGADTRSILLDAILDDEPTERLILSNSNFICIPNRIFEDGLFYALIEPKIRGFLQLFPQDEIEFCIALRNPATFIPDVFGKSKFEDLRTYMQQMDPTEVRWSDVIRRIRHVAPQAKLTVWCNEDTPLIWGTLIRALAAVPDDVPITGTYDLLSSIMAPEGMARMESYLAKNQAKTSLQEQKVITAFLAKYAVDEALNEDIDLPSFDQALVDQLSDLYEADVDLIAQMPDVNFIQP